MVCTCWIVSWCVLAGLCVIIMVCTCFNCVMVLPCIGVGRGVAGVAMAAPLFYIIILKNDCPSCFAIILAVISFKLCVMVCTS